MYASGEWVRDRLLGRPCQRDITILFGTEWVVSVARNGMLTLRPTDWITAPEMGTIICAHLRALRMHSGGFGLIQQQDEVLKNWHHVAIMRLFGFNRVALRSLPFERAQLQGRGKSSQGRINPQSVARSVAAYRHAGGTGGSLEDAQPLADFSIHGLHYDLKDRKLVDLGGQAAKDLADAVLAPAPQCPTLTSAIPRRVLMAIGLTAQYGFKYSDDLFDDLCANEVGSTVPEHVGIGLLPGLCSPAFFRTLAAVERFGLRQQVFPSTADDSDAVVDMLARWGREEWLTGLFRVAFLQSAFMGSVAPPDKPATVANESNGSPKRKKGQKKKKHGGSHTIGSVITELLVRSEFASHTPHPEALPIAALLSPVSPVASDTYSLSSVPVEDPQDARQVSDALTEMKELASTARALHAPAGTYTFSAIRFINTQQYTMNGMVAAWASLPQLPAAPESYASSSWPATVVAAEPVQWAWWLRTVGNDWRLGILFGMVMNSATRTERPPIDEFINDEIVRDGTPLPPLEVALQARAHAEELIAYLEESRFAERAIGKPLVDGGQVVQRVLDPSIVFKSSRARGREYSVIVAAAVRTVSMYSALHPEAPDDETRMWEWLAPLIHNDGSGSNSDSA